MNQKPESTEIYKYAIRILSKRDYSEFKIKNKFRLKQFEPNLIETTIELLKKKGYINEKNYSQTRIKGLIYKNFSPEIIQKKLQVEKIDCSIETINEIFEEQNITQNRQIKYLIEKKLRFKDITTLTSDEKYKLYKKILTYLNSKGHSYNITSNILDNYF